MCVCVCVCVCVKNLVEETIWPMLVQKNLKALGALRLFSFRKKNYLLR
jgi:hypothetical protein